MQRLNHKEVCERHTGLRAVGSPGSSSINGQDTDAPLLHRLDVAHQSQSFPYSGLQGHVARLTQAEQTRYDLLLRPRERFNMLEKTKKPWMTNDGWC